MTNMAKIDILPPISNESGKTYYSGIVNDKYLHFISEKVLTNKQIKVELQTILEEKNQQQREF